MAWDATKPTDDGLLINFPGECRANWVALALGTDANLLITNAKCAAGMALVDTKLAQITTAEKVSGTALTLLPNIPAAAGVIPAANLPADNVKLTGDQTVAGIKTFSSFPITPSAAPTTNYQVANKKYINDQNLNDFTAPDGAVDFNKQQATALVIENRTSSPAGAVSGQIWLRTDLV
jgi:hypothetical protein